jgi:hypothetical protein
MGRLLALPPNNRLGWKRLARSKHSSLFIKFVAYGRKKFYNIGPWWVEPLASVLTGPRAFDFPEPGDLNK